jgi:hypothetical protein
VVRVLRGESSCRKCRDTDSRALLGLVNDAKTLVMTEPLDAFVVDEESFGAKDRGHPSIAVSLVISYTDAKMTDAGRDVASLVAIGAVD